MIQQKSKKGAVAALIACTALLAVIVLLENVSVFLPASSVPNLLKPTSQLFAVLKKGAVYSLAAVSMNLLNGFTGLFSLGQAGFMLLGAYTYAILSVPVADREAVYYLYGGSAVNFSFQDMFGSIFGTQGVGGAVSMGLGVVVAMILAGCVAAVFAYLIGLPVLRLKSDYLAIATLGFAEIIKAVFQWQALGPVTNGANMIKSFPTFSSFNITDASGTVILRLSTFFPFLVSMICIAMICLLINSTYGRAFKAIREDETAAEAMGINLAKHKMLSFCTSAFFAGVSGAMFAMFVTNAHAKVYTTTMTYEILLIVVIGGIGSISGSVMATFLYVACSEWWLRFLDSEVVLSNGMKLPFLRAGFRMVVFSVVIMIVVLFFRRGIMGDKELPDLFKKRIRKEGAK
ncbi:branched-chain amino acid ABC transporter permease [Flintibacter muris]|uniref:branched-chain amino acid ABC transporter permease n=1 Tax=Flintibacter muris TaxID=2941327 RepID=UPI00204009B4|nr:branched-chain amino acid ABC transporter permease [Flintibacter muris]